MRPSRARTPLNPTAPHTTRRRVALGARPWVALCLLAGLSLGLGACSEDDGKKDTDTAAGEDAGEVDAVADGGQSDASASDVLTDAAQPDTAAADTAKPDTTPVDAGPECSAASDCAAKVSPKACEEAVCLAGTCGVQLKAGSCCEDKHCDDGAECTLDQCDTAKNACSNTAKVNCCSGKVSLMKLGFEQGGLGELSAAVSKGNTGPGAVSWSVSGTRARLGTKALYLGNACGNYDTSADPANNCEAGKDPGPVLATLATKAVTLPSDKTTLLHFWLWLDAEPMYADTLPKGTCATPCPAGASCVSVNGASQCIPEKDVLTVTVTGDKGTVKVFDSTALDKSTGGTWRHVAVDLSDYAGQSVKVLWRFETFTGIKNGFEGVWLDELIMETVCPVKGTLCTKDAPCLDDGVVCTADDCTLYANNAVKGFCFHDKAEGCCTVSSECDDGKPCTLDTCNAGECSSKPDATKPSCCKASIALVDDFDSGVLTDWTLLGANSEAARWRIDPKGGVKGSQALYFGTASFDGYGDASLGKGVGPKGQACSKKVNLKVGAVYNQATFALRMETEWSYLPKAIYKNPPLAGQPKYDHLAVVVYVGTKPEPAWSSDLVYGTTDGKWRDIVVDLDKWQGKEVQVCLTFDTGDDQVNDKLGVHVDDFRVRVACSKPACFYDAECDGSCPKCQAPGCENGACGCVALPGCCTSTAACDDGDPCTLDSCLEGQCKHAPQQGCCKLDSECSSTDVCAKAVCDQAAHTCKTAPVANCCKADKDCPAIKSCTLTSCDLQANQCTSKPKPGCCGQDADCDDKDQCTKDLCIDEKCTYQPSGASGCK